jgi:hypothetical protein
LEFGIKIACSGGGGGGGGGGEADKAEQRSAESRDRESWSDSREEGRERRSGWRELAATRK